MHSKLMLAGSNTLLQDALGCSLQNIGYKIIKEKGALPAIKSSIDDKNPHIIIWDDTIINTSFARVFEISKTLNGETKSILILDSEMLHFMAEGLLSGVVGFVHKKNGLKELRHCLSVVLNGKIFISSRLSGEIETCPEGLDPVFEVGNLSAREKTILRMINKRKTSKEIAEILNISYRTVQNHRQNICNKLGLSGRNKLFEFTQLRFG